MVLAQVFIQPEAAYHTISELGETGVVQFRDVSTLHIIGKLQANNNYCQSAVTVERGTESLSEEVRCGSETMRRNGEEVEVYGGGSEEREGVDSGCG